MDSRKRQTSIVTPAQSGDFPLWFNDQFGHAAGDQLLRVMAERMRASLPAQALLARLGGDEFVAVLPEAAHATEHAQQLLAALAAPLPTCDCTLSASIGMACAPTDGHDAQTLVQHADLAMYAAKRNGRNQLQRWPVAALARD